MDESHRPSAHLLAALPPELPPDSLAHKETARAVARRSFSTCATAKPAARRPGANRMPSTSSAAPRFAPSQGNQGAQPIPKPKTTMYEMRIRIVPPDMERNYHAGRFNVSGGARVLHSPQNRQWRAGLAVAKCDEVRRATRPFTPAEPDLTRRLFSALAPRYARLMPDRSLSPPTVADAVGPAHTTVPKSAPTPAVTPIASAPQNVTRMAPVDIPAPPARAASAPSTARKSSDDAATMTIRCVSDAAIATASGRAPPMAELAADASAAWSGRAWRAVVMPSSSRAWAPSASCAMSCSATCFASAGSRARPT